MLTELELVPARPEDWLEMRSLVEDAYSQYVERIGKPPAPMLADWRSIARAGTTTLARFDCRLVGLIVLVIQPDSVLIEDVAVASDSQGQGIGAALLAHAEQTAVAAGIGQLTLYTNEMTTENLGYYANRGFVETGRFIEDGYRRVYFQKQIS